VIKSNIKTKKFYAEAEDMQVGWGDYLRSIDVLKDKKQSDSIFTLDDYCWTLYGDMYTSHWYEGFKKHIESTSKKHNRKYSQWTKAFKVWINA
jgi:hypothetical protein